VVWLRDLVHHEKDPFNSRKDNIDQNINDMDNALLKHGGQERR
jgi:hypothetical protein